MKHAKRFLALLLSALLCFGTVPVAFSADAPPYKGIDVSRWQGNIDWAKVKAAGVDFAILRCFAYRKDATFEANYAAAKAQGIALGAYVYMYATTESAAVAEAQNVLNTLQGKTFALPVFLDVEDKDVLALDRTTLCSLMETELRLFEAAGYDAGIYTSLSRVPLYGDEPALSGYERWIARWTCNTTDKNPRTFTFADQDPNSAKKPDCAIWQFSNGGDGKVFGVSSACVDLNYCYKDDLGAAQEPLLPEEHLHTFEYQVIESTCTEPGRLILTCTSCGEVTTEEYAPPRGHTAPDADGRCALCGAVLEEPQQEAPEYVCPLCGERHDGLFGIFFRVLHALIAALRRAPAFSGAAGFAFP